MDHQNKGASRDNQNKGATRHHQNEGAISGMFDFNQTDHEIRKNHNLCSSFKVFFPIDFVKFLTKKGKWYINFL